VQFESRELGFLGGELVPYRLASYRGLRESYGALDADRDEIADTGWYAEDPLEVTESRPGSGRPRISARATRSSSVSM
jgi:hypothetical protein